MLARSGDMKQAAYGRESLIMIINKGVVLNQELVQEVPSMARAVLEEFGDVFPEEAPKGLPPIRGIEHRIDFIPGATIPNKVAYRTNSEESKELQRQIEELVEKGHVRESMSPCALPVILVPKTDHT
ncbi:unnamed protein product [Linum trigynum]|uniref:Uncharacterized protein n=1 Tax=Linum trigynum TaxID=586398 RepID=A0AAV2GLZ6_9ROSI